MTPIRGLYYKTFYGAETLSIMTFSIMTLSIMALSIKVLSVTTFSIMTLIIIGLFVKLNICDSQHNNALLLCKVSLR